LPQEKWANEAQCRQSYLNFRKYVALLKGHLNTVEYRKQGYSTLQTSDKFYVKISCHAIMDPESEQKKTQAVNFKNL